MKIIEMERRTINGESVIYDTLNECADEYRDWWCVIETEEEKIVYALAFDKGNEECKRVWNYMVIHAGQDLGVSWGDDDMYGYISPNEHVPEIKETFKDGDGDIWVRTK